MKSISENGMLQVSSRKTGWKDKEGMSPSVSDGLECEELHLGMDEKLTEILRVRIKGRAWTGDNTVTVCYRPLNQVD